MHVEVSDLIIQFIIYVFAVAYVTRFFLIYHTSYRLSEQYIYYYEDGDLVRRYLGLNDYILNKLFGFYTKSQKGWEIKDQFWSDLFQCPYCLSFWVNIPFILLIFYLNITHPFLVLLLLLSTPMLVGKLLE